MISYQAIFISPHLDDAVFSCGGLISKIASKSPVLVINVFSDYGSQTLKRKNEEKKASKLLGYETVFLDFSDFPLREKWGWLGIGRHRLFTQNDQRWVNLLTDRLKDVLVPLSYEQIYFPLGVGLHLDHQICFEVGLQSFNSEKIFFYEDLPYAFNEKSLKQRTATIDSLQTSQCIEMTEQFEKKNTGNFVLSKSMERFFLYPKKHASALFEFSC